MLCRESIPVLCENNTEHNRIMRERAVFIVLNLAVHIESTRLEIIDSYNAYSTKCKRFWERKM